MITFEQMPFRLNEICERLERMEKMMSICFQPQKTPSDLLNIQEASEMLSLTIPTIYSKVSKKELPYCKRGKKLYFSREELTNFVKEGRVLTNSEIGETAVKNAASAMNGGAPL